MKNKLDRDSNIELLRILAMLGIIISHMIGWSPNFGQIISGANKQTLFLELLSGLGKIGVHVFFLISGYFSVKKDFVNVRGLVKIWKKSLFYQVLFAFLMVLIGLIISGSINQNHKTKLYWLSNISPIGHWWFIVTYLIVMMFSPVINKLLRENSARDVGRFLLIFGVIFYGFSLLGNLNQPRVNFDDPNYRIITCVLTYAIGGFLALHKPKICNRGLFILSFLAILAHIIWCWNVVYGGFEKGLRYDTWDNHFISLWLAICWFMIFLRLKIGQIKLINWLASFSFAVYLIHNGIPAINYLWKIFDISKVYGTKWLYLYPFIVSVVIYLSCVVADLFFQKTVEYSKALFKPNRAQ